MILKKMKIWNNVMKKVYVVLIEVFVNQKSMNVCEHTVKIASYTSLSFD